MFRPNLSEAKKIGQGYKTIPLSCQMFSDIRTPVEVLKILKTVSKHCYMLESMETSNRWGRYTFIGFEPTMEITCTNGNLSLGLEQKITVKSNNPKEYVRQIIEENKSPRIDYLPPFTGGLVGYFSYDYIKYSEAKLKLDGEDEEKFKDMDLMLFDKVIVFDNLKQKIIVIINIKTENIESEYERGKKELESITNLIKKGIYSDSPKGKVTSEFTEMFSKENYCKMVEKAKKHIYEGDIFQVVLSNRFEASFEGSLLNTYRVLRKSNPSPYMFYFSSDDMEIAGASPETLIKLENNKLYTFPLAGTRPRGKDEKEDAYLEKDLLNDSKEVAEHNMLVDLGRNDIGKISRFESVKVEKYMKVEKFSHVMHIGSTVKGIIAADKDALDAIEAVLPAGTLSGAPKIKACEIINNLEKNKRGIYGGAIGYIDFTGNMDTCIAIRIAYKKNGKVFVRSGAGIVADSVPEKEYEECINKAKAVIEALNKSEEI